MKRYSKKTDLTADRCLQKKETRPENRNEGLEKHTSPHRAIPAIVENVENLNSFENRGGKISKRTVSNCSKL